MPFSSRTMNASDWAMVAPYFDPSEFDHPERMGYEFMRWLRDVRVAAGVPMVVVSDWRSSERNASAGGAENSAHEDAICDCVDIGCRPRPDDPNWNYSRARIVDAARSMGCTRTGIYPSGSLHIDRTEDRRPSPRIWIMVDNPQRR
jgi:uncharacterized protein YcbK (DUF882 family)